MAKNGTMACLDCLVCPNPWCRCIIGKRIHNELKEHFVNKKDNIDFWASKFSNDENKYIRIGSVGAPIPLTRGDNSVEETI
jgi:hypothetical protein